MGLWLKCPKCQAANPLDLKLCMECNASLENLPAAERVYILGKAVPAAPKAAAPPAAPAAPKEPAAKVPLEGAPQEANASTEPPSKRAKGRKSRKKKT